MARQERRTQPLSTLQGTITSYEKIEPLLVEAEARGRRWLFSLAQAEPEQYFGISPSDQAIYDLHSVMFAPLFSWAGQSRKDDRGVGGIVNVPWQQVQVELRQRTANWQVRIGHILKGKRGAMLDAAIG